LISTQFLRDSPLFRDLDETERAQVLIIGQVRNFAAEEVIFREGDAGDGLYIVIDGNVRISKHTAAGEEALAIARSNSSSVSCITRSSRCVRFSRPSRTRSSPLRS